MTNPIEAQLHSHAKRYAAGGWPVIPLWWPVMNGCACPQGRNCRSVGKHPIMSDWSRKPAITGLEVDMWWARHPRANVGIVTGELSGLVVVDIDPKNGGWKSYRNIVNRYGRIPETPVSITGSGGRHVLFEHPGVKVKSATGMLPGIDIRADGGLFVAPPSVYWTGKRYKWHSQGVPGAVEIAPMPKWVADYLRIGKKINTLAKLKALTIDGKGRDLTVAGVAPIGAGHRNDQLCVIAGRLIWEGREEHEVMAMVLEINASRCTPPLSHREASTIASTAYRRWGHGQKRISREAYLKNQMYT